jgi:hypothetical protein
MSNYLTRRSALKRTAAALGVPLLAGAFSSPAQAIPPPLLGSPKRIHTDLYNFDLRIPWGLTANDLIIFVYGFFPNGVRDVVTTYQNPFWGKPTISVGPYPSWPWPLHPQHPGWGLNSLAIKYGPGVERPGGSWMHFGVHFRPCRFHVHIEAWWTWNGAPIARAWLFHIHKIRVRRFWLIRLVNPRVWAPSVEELPRHLYNPRYFIPAPDALPRLSQLTTDIQPEQFGAAEGWQPLELPGQAPSLELIPDATTTLLIPNPNDDPTPPVLQMGLREAALESSMPPEAMVADESTVAIGSDRAAQEFDADTNGDGIVATPDLNSVRSTYGRESLDNYE